MIAAWGMVVGFGVFALLGGPILSLWQRFTSRRTVTLVDRRFLDLPQPVYSPYLTQKTNEPRRYSGARSTRNQQTQSAKKGNDDQSTISAKTHKGN